MSETLRAVEQVEWESGGQVFSVDGVRFHPFELVVPTDLDPDIFLLGKCVGAPFELHPFLVDYLELIGAHAAGRIVEVGMFRGGSLALTAAIARPAKLVGVDVAPPGPAAEAIRRLLEARGWESQVKPFWGVDQGDTDRLSAIVDAEFDGPLDLVVDDASHRYVPTRASFEALFPRLRDGGSFVIEDWSSDGLVAHLAATQLATAGGTMRTSIRQHPEVFSDPAHPFHTHLYSTIAAGLAYPDGALGPPAVEILSLARELGVEDEVLERALAARQPPLTRLVLELLLIHEVRPDVVSALSLTPNWCEVRRGPADLGPDFSIDGFGHDPLTLLAPLQVRLQGD